MALTETWLNAFNQNSYQINGYHPIVSRVRSDNSSRGGVALFIREDVEFTERPDLDKFIPHTFESVFITLKQLQITIGVIYRTPDSDSASFLTEYQHTLTQLTQLKENFMHLGDFSLNLLKYSHDSNVTEFADMNFEQGCIPLITKPTRIDANSASCIDNIILNKIFQNSEAGILLDDTSDHFPVFYSLKHSSPPKKTKTPGTTARRDFSDSNVDKLRG